MPPPRLVKCNSKSELRSVSSFSAKVGTDSAPCGAASGVASGDGEGPRIAGVAVCEVCPCVAVTGAGLGAICFARYISHTTSPTTQRATTIHAVRSIKNHAEAAIHRRTAWSSDASHHSSAAGPDHTQPHPTVDTAPIASGRASFREQHHGSQLLPMNRPNSLV